MGRKIFVSYKYADYNVQRIVSGITTVRDYVDKFELIVGRSDDIYKGESDNEDLSHLTDDTIWEKLKDRLYDSSVTIVFLSAGMKENSKPERDQWIPWEVSYSLKEMTRNNKNGEPVTSHANAMLAVVLPDISGSYEWYLKAKNCCFTGCINHKTDKLFTIIRKNKFNRIYNASKRECNNEETVWSGTCSYIESVKWSDFISNYSSYVDKAIERNNHIDEYNICKDV